MLAIDGLGLMVENWERDEGLGLEEYLFVRLSLI
jgi:hypothetical protein